MAAYEGEFASRGDLGRLARAWRVDDQLGEMFDDETLESGNQFEYEAEVDVDLSPFTPGRGFRSVMPARRSLVGVKQVTRDDVLRHISEVEAMLPGLPRGVLEYILNLEAGPGPFYNPSVRGGSGGRYLGLFQFYNVERNDRGAFAWGAARSELANRGIGLGSLAESWSDPFQNTLAAAGLALANRRTVEKAIGSDAMPAWKPIMFYAAHQQGAGYLIRAIRTRKPGPLQGKQSVASTTLLTKDLAKAVA